MTKLTITEREAIKEYIAARGIHSLYHFTRVENLESILQHGLLSVAELQRQGIRHFYNDSARMDKCPDANCLSISFPNYRVFCRKRKEKVNAIWVVIELDAKILYELDCAFCRTNAARSDIAALSLDERRGVGALERMYDEIEHMRGNIPQSYPTDPQAEVLALENIPPKYIKGVYVNNGFVQYYVEELHRFVDCRVKGEFFGPRCDWEAWRQAA